MVKRIAIQHPYSGLAESQSSARIIAAAKSLGIEAREIRDSHDIIAFKPDFVLSISHQDPKLTPFPTYGVMTAPSEWYEKSRFIRNILTYDAYATVTPTVKEWLTDITFGARKINTPIGFYANTMLPYKGNMPLNDLGEPSLLYIGTNWDGGRHKHLFNILAEHQFLKLYGPEKSWQAYPDRYEGHIPFDDISVLGAYRQAGVGLCIEHQDFIREGMPSSRIFEALASSTLAICARTDFNQHWFADNVLYVDMELPSGAVARQIVDHMKWIAANSKEASAMAYRAHQIFCEHFALDKLLTGLLDLHKEVLTTKGYIAAPTSDAKSESQKIGVIIRAGSRGPEFLHRSIGSVARQPYKNIKVFLILWQNPPGLERVLESYPALEIEKISLPGGARSDCQWAGLRAAKADGCDLIGILDDDDEYHPNMVTALVQGYEYHSRLSFQKSVAMISGGSLVAHASAKMNYAKFETRNVLPRPETHHIQHFHFGSEGEVNDRSYNTSPCSTFFVASFLDEEVLQNPNLDIIDDWIIWLQLAERGRLIFVPEIVSTVYEHDLDRAGYKGKTSGTFRNHVRIARRMFGRKFNRIEHYEAPAWLKHQPSENLTATVISYPDPLERPGAKLEFKVDHDILEEGTTMFLPTGYCELKCFFTVGSEAFIAKTTVKITTSLREYTAELRIIEDTHESGFVSGLLKFVVTRKEEIEAIHFQLMLPDHIDKNSFVDSQICQTVEVSDADKSNFERLHKYDRIWLYGTSKLGKMTLNILKTHNLTPAAVADTHKTGIWEGFEIVPPEALQSALKSDDVILISSEFWQEISNDLWERGIYNHMFTISDQSTLSTIFDT